MNEPRLPLQLFRHSAPRLTRNAISRVVLFAASPALFVGCLLLLCLNGSSASAHSELKQMMIQGRWAYAECQDSDHHLYIAANQATEEDVWLSFTCSREGHFTVSLVHGTRFQFHLGSSMSIQLRSDRLPMVEIEGRSAIANQIQLEPSLMRHILPLILEENRIVVSVAEESGELHNYTFVMQPNDIALRPIRSNCFGN